MDKAGSLGMRIHQGLSFFSPMLRLPKAKAVFWPGCALMTFDPAILSRTLEILRREEPMEFAAGCCGQPTRYLFPRLIDSRRESLATALEKAGVERVYTACPNCTLQLGELGTVKVIPIWPVLAKHIRPEDITALPGEYVLHDPCPMRRDPVQLDAVRALLDAAGVNWTEAHHARDGSRCCGNRHMLRSTDPEASQRIRRQRLAEFPEDRCITAGCAGCLDAFGSEGRRTAHILEVLFGKSAAKGWGNRLKFTFSIQRK